MGTLIKRDLLIPRLCDYIILLLLLALTHFISLSPIFLFIIVTIGLIISFFIYDHYYKVNHFFKSMPIQPKTMVLSRYISCLLLIFSLLIFQFIFMILITLDKYAILYYVYAWQDIIIVCCLGIILMSIIIPLFYLFKSLYIPIIIIGLSLFAGTIFSIDQLVSVISTEDDTFLDFNKLDAGYQILIEKYVPGQPYITLILITITILILSYFLSVFLFKRKDII